MFQANTEHPLFDEIHSIILKYVGIDRIITNVAKRLGDVHSVYLVGKFARGLDSNIIDLASEMQVKILRRDPALASNKTDGNKLFGKCFSISKEVKRTYH